MFKWRLDLKDHYTVQLCSAFSNERINVAFNLTRRPNKIESLRTDINICCCLSEKIDAGMFGNHLCFSFKFH